MPWTLPPKPPRKVFLSSIVLLAELNLPHRLLHRDQAQGLALDQAQGLALDQVPAQARVRARVLEP